MSVTKVSGLDLFFLITDDNMEFGCVSHRHFFKQEGTASNLVIPHALYWAVFERWTILFIGDTRYKNLTHSYFRQQAVYKYKSRQRFASSGTVLFSIDVAFCWNVLVTKDKDYTRLFLTPSSKVQSLTPKAIESSEDVIMQILSLLMSPKNWLSRISRTKLRHINYHQ